MFGLMPSSFLAARLFLTSRSCAGRDDWGSFGDMTVIRRNSTLHQSPEPRNLTNAFSVKVKNVEECGQRQKTNDCILEVFH